MKSVRVIIISLSRNVSKLFISRVARYTICVVLGAYGKHNVNFRTSRSAALLSRACKQRWWRHRDAINSISSSSATGARRRETVDRGAVGCQTTSHAAGRRGATRARAINNSTTNEDDGPRERTRDRAPPRPPPLGQTLTSCRRRREIDRPGRYTHRAAAARRLY